METMKPRASWTTLWKYQAVELFLLIVFIYHAHLKPACVYSILPFKMQMMKGVDQLAL